MWLVYVSWSCLGGDVCSCLSTKFYSVYKYFKFSCSNYVDLCINILNFLAVIMLIITSVQRSRSHSKIQWRVWFTQHHSLDWMVGTCLFLCMSFSDGLSLSYICTNKNWLTFLWFLFRAVRWWWHVPDWFRSRWGNCGLIMTTFM